MNRSFLRRCSNRISKHFSITFLGCVVTWQTISALMPHQIPPLKKLAGSRVGGLFMDMGTGKSRCAIEFAALRQSRINRVIWFCPVSLKETVRQEIIKHTDSQSICVFDDRTNIRNLPKAFWYIVGIESMSSSNRVALTVNALMTTRTFVIVDESSYIKGHHSIRTRRITHLSRRARYRMILTGTPISQGVEDLYAQMYFLSPKILGYNSFYSFAANHLEYSKKYKDLVIRSLRTDYLAAKIQPYIYQVTKEEAGLDLPAKLYDTRYFSMTYEQREAYEPAKWDILLSIPDEDLIDSYVIFQLFSALQQIVSGFYGEQEFSHYRLDVLQDIIKSLPANEKIIIWCKYRYSIRAIVEMLGACYGLDSVSQFHGALGEQERNREVDRFRHEARFFVSTAACGGHGLTLNEARYVIFYENEFKYANRLQAEDRNHRIGQTRRPTYIDIVCSNSIDVRIMDSQAKKGDAVYDFRRQVERVKGQDRKGMKEIYKSL